ncbi:EH signature domain-containing protein [Cellulomonas cellasea]|uniref:Zorya protein ZorC EH domain-containing protein n=1 Tax=Cellulomonas cellasea TaxID=43670 RepID=A0A7W4UF29_9CELL|nr:EH signature domain-containing protein [Cellulomonas cellasea]MBB2922996.1 hypothetical protein [Cellulomonas cellasea]
MRVVAPPPVPRLQLRPWSTPERDAWTVHTERASALVRGAGTGRNFAALVVEARHRLRDPDATALVERLGDRRFVRAVATVWFDDPDLARVTMTPELLGRISRGAVSRLTTITLAALWLTRFDHLDEWREGLAVAFRDTVRAAVGMQPARARVDVVESLRENDAFVLELDGPRRLAASLVAARVDLTAWFRSSHLGAHTDTRFGRVARDAYYLAQIAAADAERGDHDFLTEITSEVLARQKTETTDEDGRFFGHDVLAALTAKTTRRPSTEWLQAVLGIADDPRAAQTQRWRTWWSKLPRENLVRATRWMQGVDLTAFLDAVTEYAHATANTDLARMIERRSRFLVGLHQQDRIDDVRLVLGDDIRMRVGRSVPFTLSDVARLEGSGRQDTAIVYVDCGDFWLIEGSHNFKLHVYVDGPPRRLADRRHRSFDVGFLRDDVPTAHASEHGSDAHVALAHQGFEWVRKSLDFLRDRGIRVDEHGLMTPNDYAELSRRRAGDWY